VRYTSGVPSRRRESLRLRLANDRLKDHDPDEEDDDRQVESNASEPNRRQSISDGAYHRPDAATEEVIDAADRMAPRQTAEFDDPAENDVADECSPGHPEKGTDNAGHGSAARLLLIETEFGEAVALVGAQ